MNDTPDDADHPPSSEAEPIADPYVIGPLRRELPAPAPSRPRRRSLLVTAALGVALVASWGTGIGVLVHRAISHRATPLGALAPRAAPPGPALPGPVLPGPAVPGPRVSRQPALSGFNAQKGTTTVSRGGVTLVNVAPEVKSLTDVLAEQRTAAQAASETMLVMTIQSECAPCAAVITGVADPRMQSALGHVRLVQIDVEVFHEELEDLRIPLEGFPAFFLLGPDLSPRDGIDADEWDENVVENMAPVLGAFVHGKLVKRRRLWQPVPGAGMRL